MNKYSKTQTKERSSFISASRAQTIPFLIKKIALSSLFCFFAGISLAQTASFLTPGTSVWTIPLGVNSINIACYGGGGAGAGTNNAKCGGGGGGGGASIFLNSYSVTPGSQITIVVGAGGIGVATNVVTSGSASSVSYGGSTILSAAGGIGGSSGTSGNGGSGGLTSNNFPVNGGFKGGNGGKGSAGASFDIASGGGGGGGGASGGGNGGNATNTSGGTAGAAGGTGATIGGAGITTSSNCGSDGTSSVATSTQFGGGGGGATQWAGGCGVVSKGGSGANGAVIITYTVNTTTTASVTLSSGTSWTVPANVCGTVNVELWGGGGGGGGAKSTGAAAGGGGGGSYTFAPGVSVTPGSTISYVIGAGGVGGTGGAGDNGSAGTATIFNGTIVANGGSGGIGLSTSGSAAGGAGGTGGTYGGGAGKNGTSGVNSGGGGGSAGSAKVGNAATGMAGASAVTFGGAGGSGKSSLSNGDAGAIPGGGGGGAFATSSTPGVTYTGGTGGAGRIVITYTIGTPPTAYTVTGGGSYCSGSGVAVGLSGSQSGVSYQLKKNGSNEGSPVTGTGSSLSFGNMTAGTYTVEATGTGACTTPAAMTSSVVVSAASSPVITTQPTTQVVCSNGAASYTVATSAGSPTYLWEYSTDGSTWTTTVGVPGITGQTSNTLTISNPSVSWNGFYIHCIVNPGPCQTVSTAVLLTVNSPTVSGGSISPYTLSSGDYLWSGNTNTNWNDAGNWYQYNGSAFVAASVVPAATNRVYIFPAATVGCISAANSPTVNAAALAKSVLIGSGATLNGGNSTLTISGNFINNGIFSASNGTVDLTGDWTNNGTYTAGNGLVNFTGSSNTTIGGSGANDFYRLTVNKASASLTLNNPVSATYAFTFNNGKIYTTASNILTIGSSTSNTGSVYWANGNSTVVGPVKRWYSGTVNASEESGMFPIGNASYSRWVKLNFTSNLTTGGFIIAEYKSGACPVGYNGLTATVNGQLITNYENEGYWEIAPTGGDLNTAFYKISLRGNNLSTPNGSQLNKLRIIKSTGAHTTWDNTGIGSHSSVTGSATDLTITNTNVKGFSFFNIGSDNSNPLPVELINLSASCDNDERVEIKWSTASEQNSNQFTIEKSRDLNQWIMVQHIPAAGNSSSKIDYSAIDPNPFSGVSYYQLIQSDINGATRIYGPVSVPCLDNANSIKVFPNPNNGLFTIEIYTEENLGNVKIQLSDISGKIICSRPMYIGEGKTQKLFDEMNLQKGTYMVQIISETKILPAKVVVY